ncbi:MAG: hypothetical protein ACYDFT_00300 [Thermoplasmata archaeon]
MRGHSLGAGFVAVGVVVVLILLVVPTAYNGAGSGRVAPAAAPVVAPPNAQEVSLGQALHYTPAETAAAVAWLEGLTPAQLHAVKTEPATYATFKTLGFSLESFNYYCFGASITAGGATGGLFGSLGGPPGFLIGAVIGSVAGAIIGYYGCQQSANGADTSALYDNWAHTIIGAYGNEVNGTTADYSTIVSALNLSLVGWQRAADNAALLQIGNASFNVPADIVQSGIAAEFSDVQWGYDYMSAQDYAAVVNELDGHGTTGAVYASVSPTLNTGTSINAVNPASATADTIAIGAEVNVVSTVSHVVYIPHGGRIAAALGNGFTATIQGYVDTSQWYNWTVPASHTANESFPGPSSAYTVSTPSAGDALWFPTGEVIPTASGASTTGASAVRWAVGNPVPTNILGSPLSGSYGPLKLTLLNSGAVATATIYAFPNATGLNLEKWLANLQLEAAQNGEAYWAFLRGAGFTSLSQIPPDCLIPAPYLVLPSNINSADLTASQWMSLYLASLQGMAKFYNTSLSAANFCGTQSKHQFHLGTNTTWGNLFINATGDIYLTNGTQPINENGSALATEKFGNVSTWALTNQQLFLMPTISTITIPVGWRWAVPANDPVEIYAVQAGTDLWLTGNGTGERGHCAHLLDLGVLVIGNYCPEVGGFRYLATLAPGDSIYLTSCFVGGSASANCTATVQTLNVTVTNITCNGPCSQGAPGGGGFLGFGDPFAALANWFAGLFGGGPLGALLGSLMSAVLVVALILVGLYVLYRVVTMRRNSATSGGGSTIIVGGR